MSQSIVAVATTDQDANIRAAADRALPGLATASENDLAGYYGAAVIAKDIQDNQTGYGKGGVAKFADLIGHDKSLVYKWIKVARAFDEATITAVLEKKDKFGRRLSWSQVSLCASVPKQAKMLLERVLAESLSVTELKRVVATARRGTKEPLVPSMHGAVKELARHLSRAAAIVKQLEASPALAAAESKDAENIKALCTAALVQSKALPVVLTALIEQFEPRPGLKRAQQASRPAAKTSNKPPRQAKGTKRQSAA